MAGQPTKIDRVLETRDGKRITVAERIIQGLRSGAYLETSAAAAGVARATVYLWLKTGAHARARIAAGTRLRDLSKYERLCLDFSENVERAEAEAELADVTRLAQLGQGGLPQVETVVKVEKLADGTERELERRVKTSHTLPDASVLQWRLERKHPEKYGPRQSIEISGGGPGGSIPIDVRLDSIVDALRQLRDGEPEILDADVVEPPALEA